MTTTQEAAERIEKATEVVEHATDAYAPPGEERPLAGYATLVGGYAAGAAAFAVALKATGKKLPERIPVADLVLLGVGTHKLSWILARDRVTSFLRAPVTRFERSVNSSDVAESPRGHGLRLAAGELVTCPYCMGQWVASAMLAAYGLSPRTARFVAGIFTTLAISDQLHARYGSRG